MVSTSSIIKLILLVVFLIYFCHSQDFRGFDDTILYKINWPGKDVGDRLVKEQDENTLNLKTAIGESYQCFIPKQDELNKESEPSYNGPSPLELLSPLFSKQACSYRVDTYWIYEVCHGRHVRQYHNDRESKTQKEQEYYLGKWRIFDGLKLEEELKRLISLNYPGPTKTRKVDGVNLPYFEMSMSDGTICDINGNLRQTNVLYVCYPQSKHNVFSVKEIAICQYEIIILTSFLCTHPWYKPPNSDELTIDCLPIGDSPRKPHNLKVIQSDTSKLKKKLKMLSDSIIKKENYVLAVTIDKNGETKIRINLPQNIDTEPIPLKENSLLMHTKSPPPNNEIEEFLNGNLCLSGGSGWWKYEICYNKFVRQVHEEKGKPNKIVMLGEFKIEDHIMWLIMNQDKKPKRDIHGKRHTISHFYSSGSVCHQTGKKRETEVRYKCVEGRHNDESVALYLLEPKTCKYVLTVESAALCEIINGSINDYGIFAPRQLDKNDEINKWFNVEVKEKLEQYYIESGLMQDTTPPIEQETKVSEDKKKNV